jgi:DNA-binding NarL/FixJ family response regulator
MKTIAIVENNLDQAQTLRLILEKTALYQIIGEAHSGEEALLKIPVLKPDVVLMDIGLPGISGIETTAKLKHLLPEVLVIMMTVYRDQNQIFESLKAGAGGYLLKRSSPTEVREEVASVIEGGPPMSPEIARKVVEAFHSPLAQKNNEVRPSKREAEILDLLAQGLRNKEIAAQLELSIDTIRAHLKRIYQKFHVHSRTEAAVKFRSKG